MVTLYCLFSGDAKDLATHKATIHGEDEGALGNLYRELDQGTHDTSELHGGASITDTIPIHNDKCLYVIVKRLGAVGPVSPFEPLYKELWGKAVGFSGIRDFTIEVPHPRSYMEPKYRLRMEHGGIPNLPLCRHDKVSKKLQELKVVSELPCARSSLLIRSEYRYIEEVLEEAVRDKWAGVNPGNKPATGQRLDYEISGQPGSGKTWFLSYILVRRLLARRPTVYREDDKKCYLFSERSTGMKVDLDFLCGLSDDEKQELWILTDKALEDVEWKSATHSWFVVLVTSPQVARKSRQWRKDRNPGVHYMRNWEWHEIFAAFSLENPKVGLAETNTLYTTFTCFGPVARTCLGMIPANSSDRGYDASLEMYLSEVDREISTFAEKGGQSLENVISQNPSPKIAIMQPSDTSRSYTAVVATRWIAHRMAAVTELESRKQVYNLYKHLSWQPDLSGGLPDPRSQDGQSCPSPPAKKKRLSRD